MVRESRSLLAIPIALKVLIAARLVDEHMMLVAFGLNEGQGATDILGLLNTSSWSWVDTYTPNKEWLLYKANSTAGGDGKQISTITATTSIPPPVYSNSTIESHRNGTLAGGDKNNTGRANNDHDSSDEEQALHLRFGVVAGVISGSVVVVGYPLRRGSLIESTYINASEGWSRHLFILLGVCSEKEETQGSRAARKYMLGVACYSQAG